jgi:hypothetical protein
MGASSERLFCLASLNSRSAKVWFRQGTVCGTARVYVARWEEAAIGDDERLACKARDAGVAHYGRMLEVKGAFLTVPNHEERIDPKKVDRARQIHLAGFS